MSINDISLTAGMRTNLLSLQSTYTLLSRTQERLATGKKVNTALDNPTSYFAAQSHTQRASDLSSLKDSMTEAVQAVKAADKGITGISALIEAARGLSQSARSATREGRDVLSAQFNTMRDQIDAMAGDASYKGKNFLKGDTLNVIFNEGGSASMSINGSLSTSIALGVNNLTVGTKDVVTADISGGTGAVAAATAVHTGTMSTAAVPGNVATGTYFNQTVTGTYTRTGASGAVSIIDVTGTVQDTLGNYVASGTSYTGLTNLGPESGYTIVAVYANGVTLTGQASGGVSWSSAGSGNGNYALTVNTLTNVVGLSLVTTITFTYDIRIQGHASGTSNALATNSSVFDMKAGDSATGASGIAGLNASGILIGGGLASGTTGVAVYVSGVVADTDTYKISGTYIVFTGSAVPSSIVGSIEYNYNTGYSALDPTAAVTKQKAFTTVTVDTTLGQSITDVKVNGTSVASSYWHLSGTNSLVFSSGYEPAKGDQIAYTVTNGGSTGIWATDSGIDNSVNEIDAALATLRDLSATMAANMNIINIRLDFTDNMVSTLLKGADNLTLADMNEEGANMLMLQTRQQLGTTSLKMASDAAAAVMRLF